VQADTTLGAVCGACGPTLTRVSFVTRVAIAFAILALTVRTAPIKITAFVLLGAVHTRKAWVAEALTRRFKADTVATAFGDVTRAAATLRTVVAEPARLTDAGPIHAETLAGAEFGTSVTASGTRVAVLAQALALNALAGIVAATGAADLTTVLTRPLLLALAHAAGADVIDGFASTMVARAVVGALQLSIAAGTSVA